MTAKRWKKLHEVVNNKKFSLLLDLGGGLGGDGAESAEAGGRDTVCKRNFYKSLLILSLRMLI